MEMDLTLSPSETVQHNIHNKSYTVSVTKLSHSDICDFTSHSVSWCITSTAGINCATIYSRANQIYNKLEQPNIRNKRDQN